MELSIEDKWALTVEDLLNDEDIQGIDEFKQQIFDTYQYLESVLTDKNNFPHELMLLYKYIVQTHMYLSTKYLERVPYAISSTLKDCCAGLCYVIEKGFNNGFYEHSLPLGLTRHTPAGCASPEADMSSFDSFLKSFDDNVDLLRDYYGEDDVE